MEEAHEGELIFRVLSEEEKTCTVRASEALTEPTSITVPAEAIIGGESYTVTVVAANAFANLPTLVNVSLPDTIKVIGANAFSGCSALLTVNLPDAVYAIGERAFYACYGLSRIYLGKALTHVFDGAFTRCPFMEAIRFGGTEEQYALISMEGEDTLSDKGVTPTYEAEPFEVLPALCRYPLCDPVTDIIGVSLNGVTVLDDNTPYEGELVRYRTVIADGLITHIDLITSSRRLLKEKRLSLHLRASPSKFSTPLGYTAFGDTHPALSGRDALSGCRAVGLYDGRVFFTANPSLPNTVFHTLPDESGMNNPLYVGNLSYFNDGFATTPNRALLGTGSMLIVFKGDADGDGGIYYHTASDTGIHLIPRIYPTASGVDGVGALGGAVNFRDDPVFLGREGLIGIEKQTVNLERSLVSRSRFVNLRLLREDLCAASMAVFEGLLYLLTNGRIYLADGYRTASSKDGTVGYEWYYLSGIGSYTGDAPLYRRSAFLPEGCETAPIPISLAPTAGEAATGEIFSVTLQNGTLLYYEKASDGACYAVDSDGERTGGVFAPATVLCAAGGALFFGTSDGSLGCMNTDKRGKRLYRLTSSPLYACLDGRYIPLSHSELPMQSEDALLSLPLFEKSEESYIPREKGLVYIDQGMAALAEPMGEEVRAGEVHRYFYSYASHAYTAACSLSPDDGDIPHYAKDTLPLSVAAKVKTPPGGGFTALVRTDRAPWHVCDVLSAGSADFGNFDFSVLDFHSEGSATIPLRERERGWCFKQFRFAVTEMRRPFGLYALSYSFRTSGHIKP
jgi:hypothetical protein